MQSGATGRVIRSLVFVVCCAQSAQAWEFTPGRPCLLTHSTSTAEIELTYDPVTPLYTVTVTREAPWPDAPFFVMRFEGPNGLTISTDRQEFGGQRRALTVTDRGFGNVLDGLQYNDRAVAILGDVEVSFPLAEAADAVAAFRDCRVAADV